MQAKQIWIAGLALCASISCNGAADAMASCETEMASSGQPAYLTRHLEDDGTFSFQMYDSRATQDVTAQFYWRHAAGSGRSVVPTLDIHFTKHGFKKLRSGSYLTIDGGGAPKMVLNREYDEDWNTDFKFELDTLPNAFPAAKKLTIRLMRPAKKGLPKIQAQGTLDLEQLKQEIAAIGPADIKLDKMQADYINSCGDKPTRQADLDKHSRRELPETIKAN